jgi:hypothetical protein
LAYREIYIADCVSRGRFLSGELWERSVIRVVVAEAEAFMVAVAVVVVAVVAVDGADT